MKKIIILCLFILLTACQSNNEWKPSELTPSAALGSFTPHMSITASIDEDVSSKTMLVINIRNDNDEDWQYKDFELDVLLDNIWYDVPKKTEENTEYETIKSGWSKVINKNLDNYYDELPNGTYRVIIGDLSSKFYIER